jgi:hypothetical protein
MRSCLFVLVVLVAAVVLGLGYLGFIPSVAGVFGSDKPRDLGAKATAADLQSANAKTGVKLAELPPSSTPEGSIQYSGQIPASASFTEKELTALAGSSKWKYNPFSDVQFRIANDNSLEISGMLKVDRLQGYAAATGVSSEIVNMVMDKLNLVPNGSPPFYLKGAGSVVNNKVNFDIQQLEIGRLPVPSNLISDNKGVVTSFLENKISRIPGLSVKSATISNGALKFDGTLPEVESTVRN